MGRKMNSVPGQYVACSPVWIAAIACCVLLAMAGCVRKIGPAPETAFVQGEQLEIRHHYPFQRVWKKTGIDWNAYRTVYVADVNTDFLQKLSWQDALGRGEKVTTDVPSIARYMKKAFRKAVRRDAKSRFRLVDTPGSADISLELAIVELVPNKIAIKLGAYFWGWFTEKTREKAELILESRSRIAMEGRIRDMKTGDVIAMFTDREARKAGLSIRNYTWYGHVKSIIREWADQTVHFMSTTNKDMLKDSSPFTLKPW